VSVKSLEGIGFLLKWPWLPLNLDCYMMQRFFFALLRMILYAIHMQGSALMGINNLISFNMHMSSSTTSTFFQKHFIAQFHHIILSHYIFIPCYGSSPMYQISWNILSYHIIAYQSLITFVFIISTCVHALFLFIIILLIVYWTIVICVNILMMDIDIILNDHHL